MKYNLLILISFVLIIYCNFNGLIDDKFDNYFIFAAGIFKGLAKTEEAKCSSSIVKGKDKILEIINKCIAEIEAGTGISKAIGNVIIKLIGVDGIMSDCNILEMPGLFLKFTTKEGLTRLLTTVLAHIDTILSYVKQILPDIKDKKYEDAGIAGGHVLSLAFNFYVN